MFTSSTRRGNRQQSIRKVQQTLASAVAAAVAVFAGGNVAQAVVSGSWNDSPAVTPTITAVPATNFTSTVALKDGDIIKNGATAGGGLSANTNYYVVGVGSTPSLAIKLSTNPGGAANVTPAAGSATVTAAADWLSNWSGGVPIGVDDSANIASSNSTTAIQISKNITIGSLTFTGTVNDVNLLSTVIGNAGPFATLNFATSGPTPTVTVSGGKSLIFSDASVTATNINGKLVIAGNQGLTIDNQNAFGILPATGTVNSSVGAVKFGFLVDWSKLSGTVTLARGAFAATGGGAANGLSDLPVNNRVVLGTGTNQAQLELFGNNSNSYLRGLDGNANSVVLNSNTSGGPALTLGSYSVVGDSYNFAGSIGSAISALAATPTTPAAMRIVKIGAGTQILSGNNPFQNGNVVTINGGTLSLDTTGTIGTATGPGQASTTAAIAAQALTMHNGEFKMVGTAANPRSQGFGGALVMTNGTGTGSSYSQQSNGLSTFTLPADAAQPVTLTFASMQARNLGAASTNANANGQTTLYRGTNLGSAPGNGVATIKFTTTAPPISGTAGTTNYGVLKGALADTNAAGSGATFATYDAANGVRPLAAAEQDTSGYPLATTVVNTRLNLVGATPITGVTTQTLQLDNTSGTQQIVSNTGSALNATGGFLFSGSDPIVLTGGTLTGTAATDNEDVVIHNINTSTAGAKIDLAVTNTGAASKPGFITYNGPGNFNITGTQTMGNSGGIAFNGTGTTTLQGAINSATFMAVNQGRVQLGVGATFNNKPQLFVASGATLDLAGQSSATLTFDQISTNALYNNAGANAAGGTITNSGGSNIDLTINGAGSVSGMFTGSITGNLNLVLAKTGTALSQVLAGPNSYAGNTKVFAGNTLILGRFGALPSGTQVTLGDSGTGTAGILQLGDTNTNTSGANAPVNQEVAGLFSSGTAAATAVIGGNPNTSILTVNYNGGSPDTFAGIIGGAAGSTNNIALRKIGTGTLVLNGTTSNTYFGGTSIEGGILSVNSDNKLGNPGSVIGGTPNSPISPVLNNVVINNATLQVTASTTLQSSRGIGLGSTTGAIGGTGTIDTAGAATAVTYAGIIASAGNTGTNSLVKSGLGTLVLGGANSYNGNTTVGGGLLNVTGSIVNNGSNKVFIATDGDGTFGTSDDTILTRLSGVSYLGLGSTEVGGAFGSSADLVQGANSSGTDTKVTMKWRPRTLAEPVSGGVVLSSDVLSLTDMANSGAATGQTDPFTLQMGYDAGTVGDDVTAASSGTLYLAWLDPSGPLWKNAVDGNTGVGGSAVIGYVGSWSTFASANSVNDGNLSNFLGSWGVDPSTDKVWAVVNHNSSFAVTPEPGAIALLGLASSSLMIRRRRKH